MKKAYIHTALIFALIICSCGNPSEAPIEITERMKTLACAGDIEGFYSYIDKLSVESNLKKTTTQRIREDLDVDPDTIREFEEIVIPSLIVLKWEVINRELQNGEEGVFCNMQVLNDWMDEDSISIVFPDGKTSSWGFEDKADRLVLVSMVDNVPFDFAGLDLSLQSGTRASFESKNRAKQKVSKNIEKSDMLKTSEKKKTIIPELENNSNTKIDDTQVVISEEEPKPEIEKAPQALNHNETNSSVELSRVGYDFGAARWGMTKEQVISSQGSNPISKSSNSLKYTGRYDGADAQLEYVFSGNRLVRGRYILLNPSSDEESYLLNYKRMKTLLTNRYGKPRIDEERWTNSIYKDNPERHGFAVYIGHLSYRAKWDTARSDVLLELKSNNYNMLLDAIYNSR